MRQEDDILREAYGTRRPFAVPEGYFDSLSGQIMARLPEQAAPPAPAPRRPVLLRRLRVAAAAAVLVAAGTATALFMGRGAGDTPATAQTTSSAAAETEHYDECAMLDNEAIYACLADADY